MASELHRDAVVVDPTNTVKDKVVIRRFVGVGPSRYLELFAKPQRKTKSGDAIEWLETEASPRLVQTESAYLTNEEDYLDETRDALQGVELNNPGGNDG